MQIRKKKTEDGAIAKRIITREAEERIIDYAFQYAKDNNRTKVTAVHKANVLKKTDGLFKKYSMKLAKNILILILKTFMLMQQQCILLHSLRNSRLS